MVFLGKLLRVGKSDGTQRPTVYFCVVDWDAFTALSLVIRRLPKGRVAVLDPSERRVMVPEPNGCVVPVTVLLLFSRSVMISPSPNGWVSFVVPPRPLRGKCVVQIVFARLPVCFAGPHWPRFHQGDDANLERNPCCPP